MDKSVSYTYQTNMVHTGPKGIEGKDSRAGGTQA